MKKIALALTIAAMASIMVPSIAAHASACGGTVGGETVQGPAGPPVTVPILATVGVKAVGPLYVDVREVVGPDNLFSIWVYEETNNKVNLQRGGHAIFPDTPATSGADPCTEAGPPNGVCDTTLPTCHDQDIF